MEMEQTGKNRKERQTKNEKTQRSEKKTTTRQTNREKENRTKKMGTRRQQKTNLGRHEGLQEDTPINPPIEQYNTTSTVRRNLTGNTWIINQRKVRKLNRRPKVENWPGRKNCNKKCDTQTATVSTKQQTWQQQNKNRGG